MKKVKCLAFLACASMMLFSCKSDKTTDAAATTVDSVVVENTIPSMDNTGGEVDLAQVSGTFKIEAPSMINWTGSKPGSSHVGTLSISDGTIEVKEGNITAANFTIDMNSLLSTDLDAESGKEKLEGHLKSADFFDTEKYPTAKFELTKALTIKGNDGTRHHLTGNLTIKDVTKPVEFDAHIIVSGGGTLLTATTPSFEINRVDYGIKYNSGVINTVKDKIINDNVGVVINIRANKQ